MITNHTEVLTAYNRESRPEGQRRRGNAHFHLWARDDRDGYQEYVCILCGFTFGLKIGG